MAQEVDTVVYGLHVNPQASVVLLLKRVKYQRGSFMETLSVRSCVYYSF